LKRLKNWLLFIIVILFWSSNWAVMKIGLRYTDPLTFVFHRFLISALTLLPALIVLSRKIPRRRGDLASLLFISVINALGILSTNTGLAYETSGLSAVITYTQPIFVFCMAVPFLKEKASISRILGVSMGFLGVSVISLTRGASLRGSMGPILLLLLGAFLWAVTTIYYKKSLSHVDPVITNLFQMGLGSVLMGLASAIHGGTVYPASTEYLFAILYASVASSTVAFTLWIYLLREEEATVLSSSALTIPMAALIFGWLFLGETIRPQALIGALLIILGVYLVNRR